MKAVLPWVAAYMAILLVWALIIVRRKGPTLWKGRSLVALNISFVAATLGGDFLYGTTPSANFILFDAALIAVAVFIGDDWLLIGMEQADSGAVLEKCFTRTRLSPTRKGDGYTVNCGGEELTVNLRPAFIRLVKVRFEGARSAKKAKLVRNLFSKQFGNSFPTPRFRA
ncbi:MAG TPA: hypothetical protein VD771_03280 [Gemmatimonadaceae bacterium]|nr:hypothetical protein [Gemmatimonadaceae bacterium]